MCQTEDVGGILETYLQKQARSSKPDLGWPATAALVPMMARAMTLRNCVTVSCVETWQLQTKYKDHLGEVHDCQ